MVRCSEATSAAVHGAPPGAGFTNVATDDISAALTGKAPIASTRTNIVILSSARFVRVVEELFITVIS
jgi:hypothetical protein